MHESLAQLHRSLRMHGYSATKSRKLVFEAVMKYGPISLAGLTKVIGGSIDRSSVYRTIALFEKLEVVSRLSFGWKYQFELSDRFSPHHHHISCTACGNILPLPDNSLIEIQLSQMATEANYTLTSHQLELRGTCPACKPKSLDI